MTEFQPITTLAKNVPNWSDLNQPPLRLEEVKSELSDLVDQQSRPDIDDVRKILSILEKIPRIQFLLQNLTPTGCHWGITNKDHAYAAMTQRLKYCTGEVTSRDLRVELLRLGLHDIGKFLPYYLKFSTQHEATLDVLESIKDLLPLKPREFIHTIKIIEVDILGKYFQRCQGRYPKEEMSLINTLAERKGLNDERIPEILNAIQRKFLLNQSNWDCLATEYARSIVNVAQQIDLSPSAFLEKLRIYHASDASSYTCDARYPDDRIQPPILDFLFALNTDTQSKTRFACNKSGHGPAYDEATTIALELLAEKLTVTIPDR